MSKVDIHCHSIISDGTLNILDLVKIAEYKGMSALVLTDHLGGKRNNTYAENKALARGLRNILELPIIVGAEIYSPYGHMVLFGDRACKQFSFNAEMMGKLRKLDPYEWCRQFIHMTAKESISGGKIEHAVILPHPDLAKYNGMPRVMRDYVDAYEGTNGGNDLTGDEIIQLESFFPRARRVATTDCHDDVVGNRYIESPQSIKTTTDLIKVLRKGNFRLDIN